MQFERTTIEACSKGDRKAQERLYKQLFAPLLSICFRFANNKDDAVILLNESFYRILKNLEKQNPDVPLFGWAKRITINHCIDQYKKETTRKKYVENVDFDKLEQSADLSIGDDDEADELTPELLQKVKEEILHLPKTTQEVFQLFVLEGCSHKEIAELMDIKEGTSKWHVNNARTLLKAMVKGSIKIISSIAL
ncbi:MAG: RNA polymerase sigma factor [Flavobacteriales bacterium]|nr:RNA polymerase sigma factor [Flavobacteriales bacterium]